MGEPIRLTGNFASSQIDRAHKDGGYSQATSLTAPCLSRPLNSMTLFGPICPRHRAFVFVCTVSRRTAQDTTDYAFSCICQRWGRVSRTKVCGQRCARGKTELTVSVHAAILRNRDFLMSSRAQMRLACLMM